MEVELEVYRLLLDMQGVASRATVRGQTQASAADRGGNAAGLGYITRRRKRRIRSKERADAEEEERLSGAASVENSWGASGRRR